VCVCVCVCVCMYVCVCVCVYVCVCVGMNKCVAWRIHQYERVLHVRCSDAVWHDTHERLCAHHRCVCVCVCVYEWVCDMTHTSIWMSVWHDVYMNMNECVTWHIHQYERAYHIRSWVATWHDTYEWVCVCVCVCARVCVEMGVWHDSYINVKKWCLLDAQIGTQW